MQKTTLNTRPWLAGLASLLLPGSGHLYVGRPKRFIVIFGAAVLFYCGLGIAGKLSSFTFYITALAGLCGGTIFTAADAYRISSTGTAIRKQWFQKWWMYVILLLLLMSLLEIFRATRESALGFGVYRAPGELMEPAILQGETILVDTNAFQNAPPKVGQIVVYQNSTSRALFIKRITAVNGNSVQLDWEDKSMLALDDKKQTPTADLKGRVTSILWSNGDGRIGKDVN
jgi:signal peptidase I